MEICFIVGFVIGIIVGCYGHHLVTSEKEVTEDGCDIEELSDQDLGELLKEVLVECQRRIHEENDEDEPFKEFSEDGKK